jgi:hypothetical protein
LVIGWLFVQLSNIALLVKNTNKGGGGVDPMTHMVDPVKIGNNIDTNRYVPINHPFRVFLA